MEREPIRVLVVRPNENPREEVVENALSTWQDICGGYIQMLAPVLHDDSAVVLCNEEGKLEGLEPNRLLYNEEGEVYDVLVGNFIILDAPIDSDEFDSLSDEQVEKYTEMYKVSA